MKSRVLIFLARQLQYLALVTQQATATTFVTAWWMPEAMPIPSQRATRVESSLAYLVMRTTRVTRQVNVLQLGLNRSKVRACRCEGLSHVAHSLIFWASFVFAAMALAMFAEHAACSPQVDACAIFALLALCD